MVIEYIVDKVREKDTTFFDKLSTILLDNRLGVYFLTSIALTVNPGDTKYDEAAKTFAQSLLHDSYLDENKKTVFLEQIDYEKFHQILAFISAYEKGLENNKPYTRTKKPQ